MNIQMFQSPSLTKGVYFARAEMSKLNCNTIGLDWNMDIVESRRIIGSNKTLQGNLDPCVLYGTDEFIVNETENMLKKFGESRHIANLGHGSLSRYGQRKGKTIRTNS